MENSITKYLAEATKISESRIVKIVGLLDEGATIPFLARYRKEATGGLDEVQLAALRDIYKSRQEFEKRKEFVISAITELGSMTNEIMDKIKGAKFITEIEDIYLPFKPKKQTKGEVARKKGLEPLAKIIMSQNVTDLKRVSAGYVGKEKAASVEEAIEGACHIISEWINENSTIRDKARRVFKFTAKMVSAKVKSAVDEQEVFKSYYDYEEDINKMASHRILAMFRGENEGTLKLSIKPDKDEILDYAKRFYIKPHSTTADFISDAIEDGYKRLLAPSIENEVRAELKEAADKKALAVFTKNLEQLLLAPPFPGKRILAIDPGFRTGCKVVCLDENGKLLHNETIYPHPPQNEVSQSSKKLVSLVNQYKVEAIAVGNGTAGRETEDFLRKVRFERDVTAIMVNESGASIYSASKIARDEFPQYDITVRGAVSIGRRLADPLAELVKIDPKSIGVGQYQHDVDQKALKENLDDTVMSCVNRVGVDLNTASKELLQYVSGVGPVLAANIVEYRNLNGAFESRDELKKVPRLGPKAYEQAAGFIRIRGAKNPLDNSSVHPEAYHIVKKMAKDLGLKTDELVGNELKIKTIDPNKYVEGEFGLPTINDMLKELAKPGRDPRKSIASFEFDRTVHKVEDLSPGMILPGIITNITGFGAFVDIGVHQDGLVHISHLADRYVGDPHEVVSLNQKVMVKVLDVNIKQKRISLSMKEAVGIK